MRYLDEVPASRTHFLQPSWTASTYRDRFAAMEPYFVEKEVLDLGAGSGHQREDWFHQLIRDVASEVVGVEMSADFVDGANSRGVALVHGDAESIRLSRKFDVVFAGELIEHLSCFTGLLETAHHHLRPGGKLLLTTPNAFAISNFIYRLGGTARVHHEHTCWFCETTISQLLERHQFKVNQVKYLKHHTPTTWRRITGSVLRSALPERLARNTLLVVAERTN